MKEKRSAFERFASSGNFPAPIESFLSWVLALSCLAVSGYYYVLQKIKSSGGKKDDQLVPLVTYTREEVARCTSFERFQQLEQLLRLEFQQGNDADDDDKVFLNKVNDHELMIKLFRGNHILRRLATLAMINRQPVDKAKQIKDEVHCLVAPLKNIWSQLLEHPPPPPQQDYEFRLSLIIPLYNESMDEVSKRLQAAFQQCHDPSTVQLILVLASPMDDPETWSSQQFLPHSLDSQVKIVKFVNGTGRGPCLNFGAQHATGAMLTFCHSDTRLPPQWDRTICEQQHTCSCCAFAFGIDTPSRPVPGLLAVQVTANLRSKLWRLPYGDQCLSLPAHIFESIGGYPHQCFMEDYELVTLLRQRRDTIRILAGPPALCSPRRWVTHGVLYVTFTNSRLVRAYQTKAPAHEIYRHYYGRTMQVDESSPWEKELSERLQLEKNNR